MGTQRTGASSNLKCILGPTTPALKFLSWKQEKLDDEMCAAVLQNFDQRGAVHQIAQFYNQCCFTLSDSYFRVNATTVDCRRMFAI